MENWRVVGTLFAGLVAGALLWLGFAGRTDLVAVNPASSAQNSNITSATTPEGISQVTGLGAQIGEAADVPVPRPFPITRDGVELGTLLASAPFVARSTGGAPIYIVTFRDCPPCLSLQARETIALSDMRLDWRWIYYARRDLSTDARSSIAERALVAELALRRDYQLMRAWTQMSATQFYKSAAMPPLADAVPERAAQIETLRALVDRISAIVEENGQSFAVPALFWREGDAWFGYIGYAPETFPEILSRLAVK